MIPLPKDQIPNRLEITLKDGELDIAYITYGNGHRETTNPKTDAQRKLLSSKANVILYEGMHYKIDKDYPQAHAINEYEISEQLKYTCIGYN